MMLRRCPRLHLLAGLFFMVPRIASAQHVDLMLTAEGRRLLEGLLGLDEAEIERRIDTELRGLYGIADIREFLRLSANAQSMANKGLGVDYASNGEGLIFGLAVNATADAGDVDLAGVKQLVGSDFERAVPVGAGAQISLMAGYNFAGLGLPSLTVSVNALAYPLRIKDLDGEFYNLGLHAQLRLFGPVGMAALAEWGGVSLTSGLEVSRTRLTLDKALRNTFDVGSGVEVAATTSGQLNLVQRALTVPIEVTTSLRLLYLLSLYGGVALDLQMGGASLSLDVSSALTAADGDGGQVDVGGARLSVDEAGDPTRVMARFLVGAQVHVGPIKVFGQVNLHAADLTVGLAAGLRLVF